MRREAAFPVERAQEDRDGGDLLFIIYDLERGGPEMRLLDLARNFPPDLRMFICVTSRMLSLRRYFEETGVGMAVVPIGRAYLEPGRVGEVVSLVRRNRFAVVNTYDLKGLMLALCIRAFSGVRVRVVHHVVDLLHNYSPRQKRLLRLLLRPVHRVVCNSAASVRMIENRFAPPEKIVLIHNGVDIAAFGGCAARDPGQEATGGEIVIGTVANFREEKNYPFLLAAFERLLERYPRARLHCVGGGPLLEETRERARRMGIAERVVFTGYTEDVAGSLARMDLFVLCSRLEGFPNVLVQAMSMGIPVIASAVGGCLEIVEDGEDGLLFPAGDTDAFLRAVEHLLDDRGRAATMAAKGRAKVEREFSLPRMVEKYAKFYRELTTGEAGQPAPVN